MMRRHDLAGVLYAEDFDEAPQAVAAVGKTVEPVVLQQVAAIRIDPTFSLVELQHAVDQALEKGQSLERSRTEQDVAQRRADALEQVAAALERSAVDVARIAEAVAGATAGAVMAALAAMLPEISARHGTRELTILSRRLVPMVASERRLLVRAEASLLAELRQELAPLLHDRAVEVEWVGDQTMGPADLTVRWEHGAVTRDAGALLREIVGLIMPGTDTDTIEAGAHHGQ